MIIDCHGHYTTAPGPHTDWRASQLAAFREGRPAPGSVYSYAWRWYWVTSEEASALA